MTGFLRHEKGVPIVKLKVLMAFALVLMLTGCGGTGGGVQGSTTSGAKSWPDTEAGAKGTIVNLFMYGGDDTINQYIDGWVAPRLKDQYDITLKRTPLTDTADAVNKLLNEKQAGKDKGTIDLIWINGENFSTGSSAKLWFGPWAESLPNAKYIDWKSPSINKDFGTPVNGYEAPWGKAQFVMIYDSDKVKQPPKNMSELLAWAKENPGRFTYPAPPDFTGNAFVEQAFDQVTGQVELYQNPFDQKQFDQEAPKLWNYFNELKPYLWRKGETYPESSSKLNELYQNGEVYFTMSYNPNAAQRQVNKGIFPKSTRTAVFDQGTLSNTHYVAIPFNAPNKDGAQVVANFLESPEAQIAKQDINGPADLTALDVQRLPEDLQKKFVEPSGPAMLPLDVLQSHRIPEAQPGWLLALEKGWKDNVLKK